MNDTEDKSKEIGGRVLYFDPNNINIKGEIGDNLDATFKGIEIMNNPEDYSIAVDLEVTTKVRGNVTSSENSTTYGMMQTKGITNFLQGTELGEQNVLTSFFTDIMYNGDDTVVQNEALCINSIDIEFTSWYVASVIIKFTDIRGSALFSPSEYVENNGTNKNISDGNLFSSFFTMPYPIFNLRVKGFYGESVSYPLHLQDFKAEYNSEKGNFDITGQFIGYTYAMLSDIQMTYLIAAPYSMDDGTTYWKEQVDKGRFKTLEGNELPKIPELLKKIKMGEYSKSQMSGSDQNVINFDKTIKKINEIKSIKDLITSYIDLLRTIYKVNGDIQTGFKITIKEDSKDNNTIPSVMTNRSLKNKIEEIHISIEKYINNYGDDKIFEKYNGAESTAYFQIKNISANGSYGEVNISEIMNTIDSFEKKYQNDKKDLNNVINTTITENIVEIYQMVPSIYNFYKILLAHMETLLYIIAKCANDISKGEKREFNSSMEGTDFVGNEILPFPWFTVDNKDEWIGNYHPDFLEVKLVKSLIKARNEIKESIKESINELPISNIATDGTTLSTGPVWLPINAFDNSISVIGNKLKEPYSSLMTDNGVNVDELRAILSTRITTIVGLSASKDDDTFDDFITAEFKNMIKYLGETSYDIDVIIEALKSIDANKSNNDPNKGGKYCLLKEYDSYIYNKKEKYEYNILGANGVLPLTDDSIETLSNYIKNNKVDTDFNYYVDINNRGADYTTKYKPKNATIISGKEDCEKIYNDWYVPVKQLTDTEPKTKNILKRILLEKDYVISSFKERSYTGQPLMNRIAYVKPLLNDVQDDQTLRTIEIESGYRPNNETITEIKSDISSGRINSTIFSKSNKKSKYLFKLYLGKKDINTIEDTDIDDISISKIIKEKKKDINILTYPLIGGEYIRKDISHNMEFYSIINAKKILSDNTRVVKVKESKDEYPNFSYEGYIGEKDVYKCPLSLFGSEIYYAQNRFLINKVESNNKLSNKDRIFNDNLDRTAREAKAFLFLQTLPIDISSSTLKLLSRNNSSMFRISKGEALLIGSILWREKEEEKNKNNSGYEVIKSGSYMVIPDKSKYFRVNNNFTIIQFNKPGEDYDSIPNLNIHYDSPFGIEFVKLFEEWSINTSSGGWADIENKYELKERIKGGKVRLFTNVGLVNFNKNFNKNRNIDFIINNLGQRATKYYSIIEPINDYLLGLVNRDGTDGIQSILDLLYDECIISYTGDARLSKPKNTFMDTDLKSSLMDEAINTLIKKSEKYKKDLIDIPKAIDTTSNTEAESSDSLAPQDEETIELAVYKYLKILYDKWVSGFEYDKPGSEYKWINDDESKNGDNYKNFKIKNFKFIDRSYHDIGYKFIIDYNDVLENMVGLTDERSLYSTVTDILAKNNFLFLPMPNYQSWDNPNDFAKIFKPTSYTESIISTNKDVSDKNKSDNGNGLTSVFICMYTGEPAKTLNIQSKDYVYADNSLMLDSPESLEPDYASDSEAETKEDESTFTMGKVPAFAVSPGKQNQSYFKNISLNQNNPATTEASIGALKNLNEINNKNAGVTTISQNMFSIYSRYSYTCQVEMLGCAQIQPMMYFQLTNIPMWNGAYLIYKVNHSIRPGHMTTNFTGMKMGKTYPKLVRPTIISGGNMNITGEGIEVAPDSKKLSTVDLDTPMPGIGGRFKLKDYITGSLQPTDSIVTRIKDNLSPIINSIYDTWGRSELNKGYGKFRITSAYEQRKRASSQHNTGLAADIQLINPSSEGNNALFEHIRKRMRGGLKMDQLIREYTDNGGVTHVSPVALKNGIVSINGQVGFRDVASDSDSDYHFDVKDEIPQAKGTGRIIDSSSIRAKFIKFWKEVENDKNNIKSGWDKDKKLWFAYEDVQRGGKPTIAYGLTLDAGSIKSNALKAKEYAKLTSYNKEIAIGITDEEAMAELNLRIDNALIKIKERLGVENAKNINPLYLYAMVDFWMNAGDYFEIFSKEAIKSQPNIEILVKNSKRRWKTKANEWKELEPRNKLMEKFIRGQY